MSDQTATTIETPGKDARASWIGRAAGVVVIGCLAYATGATWLDALFVIIFGALIGGQAAREISGSAFGNAPQHDVCRKMRQVREHLVAGMDAAGRRKMKRCRMVLAAYFLCAGSYAVVLMTLESGDSGIYEEYLNLCVPLINFMSDFIPRAGALRDALLEHDYAARAEFAEHMAVMTRLFCFPAVVVMVLGFGLGYRSGTPVHFRVTRPAYELHTFGIYVTLLLAILFFLAWETSSHTFLDFKGSGGGWAARMAQYHRTNNAALVEVVMVGFIYPMTVYSLQWHIMLIRAARPEYAE